jgi:excisionase family DNA binding protein
LKSERNGRRIVPEELLTVAELQRLLSLGRTKTYELIASREIPSYKIGHVVRVRRQDVEEFLDRCRIAS